MRRPAAGEWVEVRTREEILATLDEQGCLDALPFMPEMLQFCGRRLRVFKRAHKTCDTVGKTGGRRLAAAVHLEGVRCDGSAHGGCQARCLMFWKEEWLRPAPNAPPTRRPLAGAAQGAARGHPSCSESRLMEATRAPRIQETDEEAFVCQATQLPVATTPLPWWDARQYVEDYVSGNVTVRRLLAGGLYSTYNWLINLGVGLGAPLRWLYDRFQALVGGVPYPVRKGTVPRGEPTPAVSLDVQPGEWVRVRSFDAIRATLDRSNHNRGMYFDCEEVPFCGGTYQVVSRVDHIIDETTGRMLHFRNPSVILDGVYCQSRYSSRRMFCPRAIEPMWREIWLERADPPDAG